MIDIASRATDGIRIPDRKAARTEIMRMFNNQMLLLKERFSVRQICNCLSSERDTQVLPFRVTEFAASLVSPVMLGKPAILMDITL